MGTWSVRYSVAQNFVCRKLFFRNTENSYVRKAEGGGFDCKFWAAVAGIRNCVNMASGVDMPVNAATTSAESINVAMLRMDRPNLLRMLDLAWDRKLVTDVKGTHPVTLYQARKPQPDCFVQSRKRSA